MKKSLPQILPPFSEVRVLKPEDSYTEIYKSEQKIKSAWLIDENDSLADFIQMLGKEDEKNNNPHLNFYDFYVAYNIKFPLTPTTVMLMNKDRIVTLALKDFSELLRATINLSTNEQHAIFIMSNELTLDELLLFKRKILQQFIYLKMYLPIIIAESFVKVAKPIFREILRTPDTNSLIDIGIFGTKKAGKTSTINAILGDEYSPMSAILPTPNKIVYSPVSILRKLSLTYKGWEQNFYTIELLQKFMTLLFKDANKDSVALDEMLISIPKFPRLLRYYRLIDTPGPNFAGSREHAEITEQAISTVDRVVFVMNYSQHLTQDEIELFDKVYKYFNNENSKQTILVAVNKIDEMYAVPEVKSYERIADYIQNRLLELGYENILVLTISAMQAVYTKKIKELLKYEQGTLSERLKILRKKYRGTNQATIISFINKTITDFEIYHDMEINSIFELRKISHIGYLKHLMRWLFN